MWRIYLIQHRYLLPCPASRRPFRVLYTPIRVRRRRFPRRRSFSFRIRRRSVQLVGNPVPGAVQSRGMGGFTTDAGTYHDPEPSSGSELDSDYDSDGSLEYDRFSDRSDLDRVWVDDDVLEGQLMTNQENTCSESGSCANPVKHHSSIIVLVQTCMAVLYLQSNNSPGHGLI
jgi:hypothetical protein